MDNKMRYYAVGLYLFLGVMTGISAAEVVVVEVKKVSVDDVYNMVKTIAELDRKKLVGKNLKMSTQESEKFWPIYGAYRKDINQVQMQQFKLVKDFAKNYKSLSEEKAAKLLKTHLKSKRDLLKIRKKYLSDFRKSVSAMNVAKFFQVENKLNAVVNVQLAQEIPLVK